MTKTLGSRRHRALCAVIVQARKEAGLTQRSLAAKLKMPQSVLASIEMCQRRVDVVEFLDIAKATGLAPQALLERILMHNH